MTNTREEKRTYWAKHIKQWRASGETQSSYCRHHQLKPHQMIYWRQLFEVQPKKERAPRASGFISVQVVDPPTQGLTVRFPCGVYIEGVHSSNLDIARALIGWLV